MTSLSTTSDQLLAEGFMGNLPSLPALQHRCRMTDRQAAVFCLVAPETYRRWVRDRRPNPTAVRLMAIMAGVVPWHGWQGWEMHRGLLFPPGYIRHGFQPGELLAIPFRLQLLAEYQRQVQQLERQVQSLTLG